MSRLMVKGEDKETTARYLVSTKKALEVLIYLTHLYELALCLQRFLCKHLCENERGGMA